MPAKIGMNGIELESVAPCRTGTIEKSRICNVATLMLIPRHEDFTQRCESIAPDRNGCLRCRTLKICLRTPIGTTAWVHSTFFYKSGYRAIVYQFMFDLLRKGHFKNTNKLKEIIKEMSSKCRLVIFV